MHFNGKKTAKEGISLSTYLFPFDAFMRLVPLSLEVCMSESGMHEKISKRKESSCRKSHPKAVCSIDNG